MLCGIQSCEERFVIVPRQPALGVLGNIFRVSIKFRQEIERIDPVELARIDQAHQRIANLGSFSRSVKEGISAMENCFFQQSLADVVVQRCASLAQEQRQPFPMLEHVLDRFAQTRVRLHQPLVELSVQPVMEFFHDWAAFGLVETQSFLWR